MDRGGEREANGGFVVHRLGEEIARQVDEVGVQSSRATVGA